MKKLFKKGKGKLEDLKKVAKSEAQQPAAAETAPRITNTTVAEHREEVLSSARKYIYPLQHSKHKIVLWSVGIFIATFVAFSAYCTVSLYRLQSTSTFLYKVTEVIPFPIARTGNKFIAYENYLFELRHYMHYYTAQQKLDFNSPAGRQQLDQFKKQALQKVINDAYIKQLAVQHNVTVSNQEVDDQIALLKRENRLGSSDKVFEDVLKDYWGWSLSDFKRSLHDQLLAQKVVASLDTDTQKRAQTVVDQLNHGGDFTKLAKQYSDDQATNNNGGDLGLVDKTSRLVAPQAVEALFALKAGQTSAVINTGYSLEIVKNLEVKGDKIHAAHIVLNFKDISGYLNDLKDKQKTRVYIKQ